MQEIIRLVSEEDTGCTYYTTKNKKNTPDKIRKKKYDWKLRKHCYFIETKMPSHKKN